jgi:hypothetical protein
MNEIRAAQDRLPEVDLATLRAIYAYLDAINNFPLTGLVWTHNGAPVVLFASERDDMRKWPFVGLSNVAYAQQVLFPARCKETP